MRVQSAASLVILSATFAVAMCGASCAAPQSDAEIRSNIYDVFKKGVVGVGRLDGELVTNVDSVDDCRTRFITRKGSTEVDFSKAKAPFAARTEARAQMTELPDAQGRLHRFTTPRGSKGRDLQTPMYFSYTQCHQTRRG